MRKKQSREEAKKTILRHAERREHPVLVGEAALVLGPLWSLTEVESLISEMVREGGIRPITEEEKARWDLRHGYTRCK